MAVRRREQLGTARREGDSAALSREELGAHEVGEPPERCAHGGLREVEEGGGAGDAARLGDDCEDPQKVEVEVPLINRAHVGYTSYHMDG